MLITTYDTGTSSYRPKRGCEFADRMVFSNKVRFPGCRKKQRLISSGLRKLQSPEWQRLSLACHVSTGGSNDDGKGGFEQVG